jgi:K+-sensing histidine kinase KdpD
LIDEVVPQVLPVIKRKGLQLLINNHLHAKEERHGDRDALLRILLLLIQYAVTTTQIGKITLEVSMDESAEDRLTFRILDTGNGVSNSEIDNLHFPFLNTTQAISMVKPMPSPSGCAINWPENSVVTLYQSTGGARHPLFTARENGSARST